MSLSFLRADSQQGTAELTIAHRKRSLVIGQWTCNLEVSVAYIQVNSQLVSLPPAGILNLLCSIYIIFVCYVHSIIFTWNWHDINVIIIIFFFLRISEFEQTPGLLVSSGSKSSHSIARGNASSRIS